MLSRRSARLLVASTLMLTPALIQVAPSVAQARSVIPTACVYTQTFTWGTRTAGFKKTGIETLPTAGPASTTLTLSGTASQSVTLSGSVAVSASDIVSSAEVRFGIDYTTSFSATKSSSYTFTVASGESAMARIYHRADADGFKVTERHENCTTTTTSTITATIPLATTDSTSYCVTKDSYPYTDWWAGTVCKQV